MEKNVFYVNRLGKLSIKNVAPVIMENSPSGVMDINYFTTPAVLLTKIVNGENISSTTIQPTKLVSNTYNQHKKFVKLGRGVLPDSRAIDFLTTSRVDVENADYRIDIVNTLQEQYFWQYLQSENGNSDKIFLDKFLAGWDSKISDIYKYIGDVKRKWLAYEKLLLYKHESTLLPLKNLLARFNEVVRRLLDLHDMYQKNFRQRHIVFDFATPPEDTADYTINLVLGAIKETNEKGKKRFLYVGEGFAGNMKAYEGYEVISVNSILLANVKFNKVVRQIQRGGNKNVQLVLCPPSKSGLSAGHVDVYCMKTYRPGVRNQFREVRDRVSELAHAFGLSLINDKSTSPAVIDMAQRWSALIFHVPFFLHKDIPQIPGSKHKIGEFSTSNGLLDLHKRLTKGIAELLKFKMHTNSIDEGFFTNGLNSNLDSFGKDLVDFCGLLYQHAEFQHGRQPDNVAPSRYVFLQGSAAPGLDFGFGVAPFSFRYRRSCSNRDATIYFPKVSNNMAWKSSFLKALSYASGGMHNIELPTIKSIKRGHVSILQVQFLAKDKNLLQGKTIALTVLSSHRAWNITKNEQYALENSLELFRTRMSKYIPLTVFDSFIMIIKQIKPLESSTLQVLMMALASMELFYQARERGKYNGFDTLTLSQRREFLLMQFFFFTTFFFSHQPLALENFSDWKYRPDDLLPYVVENGLPHWRKHEVVLTQSGEVEFRNHGYDLNIPRATTPGSSGGVYERNVWVTLHASTREQYCDFLGMDAGGESVYEILTDRVNSVLTSLLSTAILVDIFTSDNQQTDLVREGWLKVFASDEQNNNTLYSTYFSTIL